MGELFLKIVNMSIAASWLILAVLLLRLPLKKAPKWVNVLLWSLVAFRLLCPVSIESILSLIPSAETIPGKVLTGPSFRIHSGIDIVDTHVNGYLGDGYYEGVTVAMDNGLHIVSVLALIWAAGIFLFLAYTAFSYWRLHRQVGTAVLLQDNIFQSEFLDSPFVLGLIKPKIYLPLSLPEPDVAHVIAHEQAHLHRRDHWWKPLGFLLLTLHWFNPFMWLGYILLCRDIELACDEKVIRELGTQQRADYSQALLRRSVSRRWIAACPLAFGEVGVKQRIKRVLHYKKPAFWIIATAILACILIALCFLTDPLVFGVRDIHLTAKGSSGANLTIRYLGIHSYSVEQLDADDGEYIGDGLIDYDSSLGKYRILIKLGDAKTTDALREKYPAGEVHVLEGLPDAMGSTLKMKLAYPDDSSLFLYLGSDYPIWAEETDVIKLPDLPFPRNITVKISLEDPILHPDKEDPIAQDYASATETPPDTKRKLTMAEVITLSEKGYDLTWEDFENYEYTDIGSGVPICIYEINEAYFLLLHGPREITSPQVICLMFKPQKNSTLLETDGIDIREADILDFLLSHSKLKNNKGIYIDGSAANAAEPIFIVYAPRR